MKCDGKCENENSFTTVSRGFYDMVDLNFEMATKNNLISICTLKTLVGGLKKGFYYKKEVDLEWSV